MIIVRTKNDELFNYSECEELFNRYKDILEEDGRTFRDVLENTFFYSFYDICSKELLGCAYYFNKGNKLYVSAFAERGHNKLNMECFQTSLTWWNCNIYAYCKQRPARLMLLRSGFKKISKNMYMLRRT